MDGSTAVTLAAFGESKGIQVFPRVLSAQPPTYLKCSTPTYKCAMVKSRYIGDGHPTFNRNPYNGYINPYYWADDHPILYGTNGTEFAFDLLQFRQEFSSSRFWSSWSFAMSSHELFLAFTYTVPLSPLKKT